MRQARLIYYLQLDCSSKVPQRDTSFLCLFIQSIFSELLLYSSPQRQWFLQLLFTCFASQFSFCYKNGSPEFTAYFTLMYVDVKIDPACLSNLLLSRFDFRCQQFVYYISHRVIIQRTQSREALNMAMRFSSPFTVLFSGMCAIFLQFLQCVWGCMAGRDWQFIGSIHKLYKVCERIFTPRPPKRSWKKRIVTDLAKLLSRRNWYRRGHPSSCCRDR
ncbi:hypothetical protein BT69DRAFT_197500 [Atractiella rhizophila]|nr:hypothetical protein BT69DRAFT_197500 [Atractiella rhizophila]